MEQRPGPARSETSVSSEPESAATEVIERTVGSEASLSAAPLQAVPAPAESALEPADSTRETLVASESFQPKPPAVAHPDAPIAAASADPLAQAAQPVARAPAETGPQPALEPTVNLIERAGAARTGASLAATAHAAGGETSIPRRFELPPDMVMIETSPGARRAAEQPVESTDEPVQQRRLRRPPLAAPDDEPLVQIETRK